MATALTKTEKAYDGRRQKRRMTDEDSIQKIESALARKMLVALWKYLKFGKVPSGAKIKVLSE
jgi:hypothetical protein